MTFWDPFEAGGCNARVHPDQQVNGKINTDHGEKI
jgi:hypothetical protein